MEADPECNSETPALTNGIWEEPAATVHPETWGFQNNSPSLDSDHPSQPNSGQMACSPETAAGVLHPFRGQRAQAECPRTLLSYRYGY